MERQYLIIDPVKFRGTAEAIIYTSNGIQYVDCSGYLYNNKGPDLTVEQYKQVRKCPDAIVLNGDEVEARFMSPYLKSLQKEWEEISEDQFENALEAVPPRRWTRKAGNPEFFFLGECFTANIYGCYMSWKGKFYTALREITTPQETLYTDLLNQISK